MPLQFYLDFLCLQELPLEEHSHIPYPILILQTIDHWMESHSTLPATRQEKREFSAMLTALKCSDSFTDGTNSNQMEENISEAVSKCNTIFRKLEKVCISY